MADVTATVAAQPSDRGRPKKADAPPFELALVVLPGPDGSVPHGAPEGACTAALEAGYRPVGEPTVKVTDHENGRHKRVTWSVPVRRNADNG